MKKIGISIVLVFLFSLSLLSKEFTKEERALKILQKIDQTETSQIWKKARFFWKWGDEAVPFMAKNLNKSSGNQKLIFASLLFRHHRYRKALQLTRNIILSKKENLTLQVMALQLLDKYGKSEQSVDDLKDILSEPARSPFLKIEVAKIIRKIGYQTVGSRFLKKYLKSSNLNIQRKSAIALAEIGNPSFKVKSILSDFALEPTQEGRYAWSLLEQIKLLDSLSKTQGLSSKMQVKALESKIKDLKREKKALQLKMDLGINTGKALLDEIIDKIERYYDYKDPREIDRKALLEAAAKGITNHLDPHSIFFTPKETKAFQESMASQYPGIGAYVQKSKQNYLKISQTIYSGPAYKAGMRSGDIVTEVFHKKKWLKTNQLKIPEIISKLKGPVGTTVKIKVWRSGWKKEKIFNIERQFIKIPLVYFAMLPGQVGYLQLTSFGEKAVPEFKDALKKLESKRMKGLVIDLRNNPGGLLHAAVKIADLFLKENKLIVYSKGRNTSKAPRRDYYSTNQVHPDYPIVVLVNENSASAAEILSGALKIHKRAILVGTKTYGKGSVQLPMLLRSTRNKALLKLTIAKYYLPDGTNIDHKGIEVNRKVSLAKASVSIEEYQSIFEKEDFLTYLKENFAQKANLFYNLAQFDGYDYTKYPNFEKLYKNLQTTLPKNVVRRILRYKLRKKLADQLGKILVGDFQEDNQLQVAIFEVLKKIGTPKNSLPEYKIIQNQKKFTKK